MSRKVLLLKPRLDLPFKKFGLELPNTSLPEIRTHWAMWMEMLEKHHREKGDKVVVVEAQRFQFHNSLVDQYDPDIAYIPHVEKHNFGGDDRCRYFMQTVVPWLFTVDDKGWGGGGSFVGESYDTEPDDNGQTFANFQDRVKLGHSKYEQPNDDSFFCGEEFIFCPLQIPHDETILWHSKVKMEEVVQNLCEWSDDTGHVVVFKSHPMNQKSMEDMRRIATGRDKVMWIDHANIHNIIPKAKAVYVINSGTGMESMCHEVPVVRFGDAEYNDAVIKGDIYDLDETLEKVENIDKKIMVDNYAKFYNWFVNKICYNYHHMEDFEKL